MKLTRFFLILVVICLVFVPLVFAAESEFLIDYSLPEDYGTTTLDEGATMYFLYPLSGSACDFLPVTHTIVDLLDAPGVTPSSQSFEHLNTNAAIVFRNMADLYSIDYNYKLMRQAPYGSACSINNIFMAYLLFSKPGSDANKMFNFSGNSTWDMKSDLYDFNQILEGIDVEGDHTRMTLPLEMYCQNSNVDESMNRYDLGNLPFEDTGTVNSFCTDPSASGCEPFMYSGVGGCCSDKGPIEVIEPAAREFASRFYVRNGSVLLLDRELHHTAGAEIIPASGVNSASVYDPWDFFSCYEAPIEGAPGFYKYRWGSIPEICAAKGGIILGANKDADDIATACDASLFPGITCPTAEQPQFCTNCNFNFWSTESEGGVLSEFDRRYKVDSDNPNAWYDPIHSFSPSVDSDNQVAAGETEHLLAYLTMFKRILGMQSSPPDTNYKQFKYDSCCGDSYLDDIGSTTGDFRVVVPDNEDASPYLQDTDSYSTVCAPVNYKDGELGILHAGFKGHLGDEDTNVYRMVELNLPEDTLVEGSNEIDYSLLGFNQGYTLGNPHGSNWLACMSSYGDDAVWSDGYPSIFPDNDTLHWRFRRRGYNSLSYKLSENDKGMYNVGNTMGKYMRPPFIRPSSSSLSVDLLGTENPDNPKNLNTGSNVASSGATMSVDGIDVPWSAARVPCDYDGDGYFADYDVLNQRDCTHYNKSGLLLDCDDADNTRFPNNPLDHCGDYNDSDCECAKENTACTETDDVCKNWAYDAINYTHNGLVFPYRFMCNGDAESGFFVECCGYSKHQCVNKHLASRTKESDMNSVPQVSEKHLRRIGSPLNTLFEFPCSNTSTSSNCAGVVGVDRVGGFVENGQSSHLILDMELADMDLRKKFFDYINDEDFEFLNVIIKTSSTYDITLGFADCTVLMSETDIKILDPDSTEGGFSSCDWLKNSNGNPVKIPLARYISNGPALNKWLHVKIPIKLIADQSLSDSDVDLLIFSVLHSGIPDISINKKVDLSGFGKWDEIYAIDRIYLSKAPIGRNGNDYTQKDYYCSALTPLLEKNAYESFWVSGLDYDVKEDEDVFLEYGNKFRDIKTAVEEDFGKMFLFKSLCNSISGYKWTGSKCCGYKSGDVLSKLFYDNFADSLPETYSDDQHGCLFSTPLPNGARAGVVGYQFSSTPHWSGHPVMSFCYNTSDCLLPVDLVLPNFKDSSNDILKNEYSVSSVVDFSAEDGLQLENLYPEQQDLWVYNTENPNDVMFQVSQSQPVDSGDVISAHVPMSLLYYNASFYSCDADYLKPVVFDVVNNVEAGTAEFTEKQQCDVAANYFCDPHKYQEYPTVSVGWSAESSGELMDGSSFTGEIGYDSENDVATISANEFFVARPYERNSKKHNNYPSFKVYQTFGDNESYSASSVRSDLLAKDWIFFNSDIVSDEDVYSPNYFARLYSETYAELSTNEFQLSKTTAPDTKLAVLVDYDLNGVVETVYYGCTINSVLKKILCIFSTDQNDVFGEGLELDPDSSYIYHGPLLVVDSPGMYRLSILSYGIPQLDVDNLRLFYNKYTSFVNIGSGSKPPLPEMGFVSESCCPTDHCWTGDYCVAAELYERNASREPMFITGSGDVGYRCVVNASEYEDSYDVEYADLLGQAQAAANDGDPFDLPSIPETAVIQANEKKLNASWVLVHKKYSWDRSMSGWCPYDNQCLVNSNPSVAINWKYGHRKFVDVDSFGAYGVQNSFENRNLLPQCINHLQFIGDHVCYEGEWTTRTRMVADHLLDYYSNRSRTPGLDVKEASLYCSDYKSVINDLTYDTMTSNGDTELYSRLNPGVNGESPCAFASDAESGSCINNVCVLSIKYESPGLSAGNEDMQEETLVGTSLNSPLDDEQNSFININLDYADCLIDHESDQYIKCGENSFFRGDTHTVIFSDKNTAEGILNPEYKSVFTKIVDWVTNLFYYLFGESLDYKFAEKYVRQFAKVNDFNSIYMLDYSPGLVNKSVIAYFQSVNPEKLQLTYYFRANFSGFSTGDALCDSLRTYDYFSHMNFDGELGYDILTGGSSDGKFDDFYCGTQTGDVLIEAQWNGESETQDTVEDTVIDKYRLFDVFKKITGMLRVGESHTN